MPKQHYDIAPSITKGGPLGIPTLLSPNVLASTGVDQEIGGKMSLIAIEAAIRISDPAKRDAAVAAAGPIQKATRDDEPGCLVYCFAADPCENDLIQVYELWEDEDTLNAHFDHPNYHNMREMLGGFGLKSAVSRKHLISKSAPVYGSDMKASAKFE